MCAGRKKGVREKRKEEWGLAGRCEGRGAAWGRGSGVVAAVIEDGGEEEEGGVALRRVARVLSCSTSRVWRVPTGLLPGFRVVSEQIYPNKTLSVPSPSSVCPPASHASRPLPQVKPFPSPFPSHFSRSSLPPPFRLSHLVSFNP